MQIVPVLRIQPVVHAYYLDLKHQVNGLVHISQLADEFVANCDDHVKEGDMVRHGRRYWQRS